MRSQPLLTIALAPIPFVRAALSTAQHQFDHCGPYWTPCKHHAADAAVHPSGWTVWACLENAQLCRPGAQSAADCVEVSAKALGCPDHGSVEAVAVPGATGRASDADQDYLVVACRNGVSVCNWAGNGSMGNCTGQIGISDDGYHGDLYSYDTLPCDTVFGAAVSPTHNHLVLGCGDTGLWVCEWAARPPKGRRGFGAGTPGGLCPSGPYSKRICDPLACQEAARALGYPTDVRPGQPASPEMVNDTGLPPGCVWKTTISSLVFNGNRASECSSAHPDPPFRPSGDAVALCELTSWPPKQLACGQAAVQPCRNGDSPEQTMGVHFSAPAGEVLAVGCLTRAAACGYDPVQAELAHAAAITGCAEASVAKGAAACGLVHSVLPATRPSDPASVWLCAQTSAAGSGLSGPQAVACSSRAGPAECGHPTPGSAARALQFAHGSDAVIESGSCSVTVNTTGYRCVRCGALGDNMVTAKVHNVSCGNRITAQWPTANMEDAQMSCILNPNCTGVQLDMATGTLYLCGTEQPATGAQNPYGIPIGSSTVRPRVGGKPSKGAIRIPQLQLDWGAFFSWGTDVTPQTVMKVKVSESVTGENRTYGIGDTPPDGVVTHRVEFELVDAFFDLCWPTEPAAFVWSSCSSREGAPVYSGETCDYFNSCPEGYHSPELTPVCGVEFGRWGMSYDAAQAMPADHRGMRIIDSGDHAGSLCVAYVCRDGQIPPYDLHANFSNCKTLRTGDSCEVSCDRGFVPTPSSRLGMLCAAVPMGTNREKWHYLFDASKISCSESVCTTPSNHQPGVNLTDCEGKHTGDVCLARCPHGRRAVPSNVTLVCDEDGTFDTPVIECIRTAGSCALGPVPGTLPPGADCSSCRSLRDGELCQCNFDCTAGYRPPASSRFRLDCSDPEHPGSFNASGAGACLPEMCNYPLFVRSGGGINFSSCSELHSGDSCFPSCAVGYRPEPESINLTCTQAFINKTNIGVYDARHASCAPNSCRAPHPGSDAPGTLNLTNCNGKHTGQECELSCGAGYSPAANPPRILLTCLPNGSFMIGTSTDCVSKSHSIAAGITLGTIVGFIGAAAVGAAGVLCYRRAVLARTSASHQAQCQEEQIEFLRQEREQRQRERARLWEEAADSADLSDDDGGDVDRKIARLPSSQMISPQSLDLECTIGWGSFGTVWRAQYTVVQRPVAVKELTGSDGSAASTQQRLAFLRECELLSELRFGFVQYYGLSRGDGGRLLMVTEYMDGGSALTETHNLALRPAERAALGLRAGLPVACALAYIHERGLVHMDVASRNVLRDSRAGYKLGDVGLMQRPGARWAVISIPWAPPEAHKGDRTVRFGYDQWAWGCFMYECLEGNAPWWVLKSEPGVRSPADWGECVKRELRKGARLSAPRAVQGGDALAARLWQTAQEMWAEEPSMRPNMAHAVQILTILSRSSPKRTPERSPGQRGNSREPQDRTVDDITPTQSFAWSVLSQLKVRRPQAQDSYDFGPEQAYYTPAPAGDATSRSRLASTMAGSLLGARTSRVPSNCGKEPPGPEMAECSSVTVAL